MAPWKQWDVDIPKGIVTVPFLQGTEGVRICSGYVTRGETVWGVATTAAAPWCHPEVRGLSWGAWISLMPTGGTHLLRAPPFPNLTYPDSESRGSIGGTAGGNLGVYGWGFKKQGQEMTHP